MARSTGSNHDAGRYHTSGTVMVGAGAVECEDKRWADAGQERLAWSLLTCQGFTSESGKGVFLLDGS